MTTIRDIVEFESERLFHGAVNIDWFQNDKEISKKAAESFVFHGPLYHGVAQEDVGVSHEHHLQDTATFARLIVRRCFGGEEQPFTLAVAGYGTGKSHLALSLATLLADPTGEAAGAVLANLHSADPSAGGEIRVTLSEQRKPCLVVALNGMGNFDLTAEITQQIARQVKSKSLDTGALDDLRPRFKQAANLIRHSNETLHRELLEECDLSDIETLLSSLEKQDERIYAVTHRVLESRGMSITALGGESLKDVIDVVSREYCGEHKPFARLLILFDEFGRYIEFATLRSQIAGSGVLQDLFEAVQAHPDEACFVGFIQFELNAYVQRIAPEFRNDILRYVTRYQAANKAYLSINLETLIASLIKKNKPDALDAWFDTTTAIGKSSADLFDINQWFPQSRNHNLWQRPEDFHNIISKGCWPLSPYSTWFLFFLTSAGKHLQERSALALLGDVFNRYHALELPEGELIELAPANLWSEALEQELLTAEDTGLQGAITHSYSSVNARHGAQFSNEVRSTLRSIVLASKLGLQVKDREDAIDALTKLSGLHSHDLLETINLLQDEYNVVEWDESFKSFDILGDAVPRTQFLSFLRQRVASTYDESGKAKLFASKASDWCEFLGDLDCDFAENNEIYTREWNYQGVTSDLETLFTHIGFAAEEWKSATSVDENRGWIIYCYVEADRDPDIVANDVRRRLRSDSNSLPILVVLLCDAEGELGKALAEFAVLKEGITESDRSRFGNLIGAHKEKMHQAIRHQTEKMIKDRHYVTGLTEEVDFARLTRVGTDLFQSIYTKSLPFPFDGYNVARGNAADTCMSLTIELLQGKLDHQSIMSKPAKDKNRAIRVLKDSWGTYTDAGVISRKPSNPRVRALIEKWERILKAEDRKFILEDVVKDACLPPYGLNLASVGLLLGVFISPRKEDIAIVQDGQQSAVSQWGQGNLFRGKHLDLAALSDVELVLVGEASSEWEDLLDEWEREITYNNMAAGLDRAYELRNRVPLPPLCSARFGYLETEAMRASGILKQVDRQLDEILNKLQRGCENKDVSNISWAGAELVDLRMGMRAAGDRWVPQQLSELDPHIETATQSVIRDFPDWIQNQAPMNAEPRSVGDFVHRMKRLTGENLKKLALNEQYDRLIDRTDEVEKKVKVVADAQGLIISVNTWLEQQADALRIIRMAKIRGLIEAGRDYTNKLRGMSQRIDLSQLTNARERVAAFQQELKIAESQQKKRAEKLWNTNELSIANLEPLVNEADELINIYEGLENDLETFRLMRRILGSYNEVYNKLQDRNLTWDEFRSRLDILSSEMSETFIDEEPPWDIDKTIKEFAGGISQHREKESKDWINSIESKLEDIQNSSASETDRIYQVAQHPPAVLTDADKKRLDEARIVIDRRIENIAVDVLIVRFNNLSEDSKKIFLQFANELISSDQPEESI
jgi:hypothetical protein